MLKDKVEDKEAAIHFQKTRTLNKFWKGVLVSFTSIGVLLVINQMFQLRLFGFYPMENSYYYYLLSLFLSMAFIVYPINNTSSKDKVPTYDVFLFVLALVIGGYFGLNGMNSMNQGWEYVAPVLPTTLALAFWLLVIEAARRAAGWILACVVTVFSLLPLYTEYLPWILRGQPFDLLTTARIHIMGIESVLGLPLATFANLMVGFIIFGVVLQASGGGQFFLDLSQALLGRVRGGPAKVAVLSSAFFGSISGSSVSNVMTTGPVTIHAMKRTGYSARYAGAIEACASTGGVVTPPIMGATAFVMANFLALPYASIVIAATIPALLYFWGLYIQVDGYAAKNNIKGLPKEEMPALWPTFKQGWYYLLALFILIYFLFYLRIEAWAPFYASLFLFVIAMLRKATRFTMESFAQLFADVGKVLIELLCILAGVGLLIGSLTMTGVAFAFSRELVNLVGGSTFLMLVSGAITCFILGMGMTVTAVYIFLAIVLAPALVTLGMEPLAVHLFILYWGIVSFITPPVAISSFAAAGISNASPMKTALTSSRIGFALYLVPFIFVYNPALLFIGTATEIVFSIFTALLAIFILGSTFEGYLMGVGKLQAVERLCLMIPGVLLIVPNNFIALIGLGIFILLIILSKFVTVSRQTDVVIANSSDNL